ncbi:MAG: ABC transporter ATP-binding protein [Chromatiales bacterium]|nr:ABC transporter ATP-binding protein [Gammaproteobacteria bacterium]MBW6475738.1 ABC transporter ATP-binding protein [Chromatiales bacterium]
MSQLEARDLSLRIGGRLLCEGLTLSIRAGECWGILGPNGGGKTSLLHCLAGLRAADAGQVQLQGRPLQQHSRQHIARHIGLLLQDNHDPFPATVRETVLSGRHPHLSRWQNEGPDDQLRADQAMRAMELEALAPRMVQTLSGGERRRLAIATLLAQDPDYLLLDEPLNHLDLRHQQQLLSMLAPLQERQKAIAMVLHEPNHALHYCDQVLLLYGDGRWESGNSKKILNVERLSALYQCQLRESQDAQGRWFHF